MAFLVNAFLKENKILFYFYGSFLLIGAALLFLYGKASVHLWINRYHSPFFDEFFKIVTQLAEGYFITLVILCLMWFRSFKSAALVFFSNITAAAVTQLLKRFVFDDVLRPKAFFQGIADLYFVPGVEVHSAYSFPSGHTTAAFATFFSLALLSRKKYMKVLFFLVALVVGFSRMYLSQHFLSDVYAGAIIGTVFSILLYQYFYIAPIPLLDKPDSNLRQIFRKK